MDSRRGGRAVPRQAKAVAAVADRPVDVRVVRPGLAVDSAPGMIAGDWGEVPQSHPEGKKKPSSRSARVFRSE